MKNTTMRRGAFYCFSPPVMLATFIIEVSLMVYALVRYKMTPTLRLIAALLFSLGTFQAAEYFVCEGLGLTTTGWSRLGFVAITMLPALGFHLAQVIAKRPDKRLTAAAYGTALVWVVIFGASEWAFSGYVCTGNYVIFQLRSGVAGAYSAYYYLWLLAGIWFCCTTANQLPHKQGNTLRLQGFGYLIFLVPTALAMTLNPAMTNGIPSIMCGFAVFYALILAFGILPRVTKRKG